MQLTYVLAAVVAVAVAAWLQRGTSMARGYAWLSRIVAAVFAALFVPTIARNPDLPTIAQAVVFTCLPLIVVPYQVRMMKFIEGAKAPRSTTESGAPTPQSRGPGGGRVRPRGNKRR